VKFPNYSSNDWYITGESYAGVYIPNLVDALIRKPIPGISLKGFAVGDGCLGVNALCGPNDGPYWNVEFMHGHGQFSNQLYRSIQSTCTEQSLKKGPITPECNALLNQMNTEVAGYFAYALYDTCSQNVFQLQVPPSFLNQSSSEPYSPRNWFSNVPKRSSRLAEKVGGAENDYPCPGPAMDIWINRTDVRRALHVPINSYFFDGDNGVGFNYTSTEPNVLPFYEYVVKAKLLKVLVYNGDTDPSINSFVTQDKYFEFFQNVGIVETAEWRAWTLDGQQNMGGYVTEFADGVFNFLTIRGSGHMVPEFKPAAAQTFMSAFISGSSYPPYNPN